MNVRDLFQERGISFVSSDHSRGRSGWLNLNCPVCGDTKYHLGFNEASHYFYCWRCGWHSIWEIFKELFLHENIKNLLAELDLPLRPQSAEFPQKRGVLRLPSGIAPLLPPHENYLTQRGFSPEWLMKVWGVQGIGKSPANPQYQWRIFIPVYWGDKVVSWTTRAIGESAIPYRAADKEQEALPLKTLLYGEQFLTHYDTVIVTEGVFDAWNIGIGAVCTFGKAVTSSQVRKISQYQRRIICFDNEPEAQEGAKKLCEELSLFAGTTVRVNLDAADPGSASKKEIILLRKTFLK
jgi:ribosomal protein S27E